MDQSQTQQNQQNGKGSASNDSIARSQAGSGDARAKLMDELNTVISNAESWLSEAKTRGADEAAETRARFEDALRTARTDLLKIEDSVIARGRMAARSADMYVKDNPWKAVGLGAAVGVIVGLLVSRK